MWRLNSGNIVERVIVSDHGSWENAAGRVPAPGGYGADAVPGARGGTDGQAATGPGARAGGGALQRPRLAALPDRGLGPAPGRLGGADPVAGRPGGLAAVQPPSHAPAGPPGLGLGVNPTGACDASPWCPRLDESWLSSDSSGDRDSANTAPAITTVLSAANSSGSSPARTCSWKASTPHRIEMIGSDRVRPGCAAISRPAFRADCTRNTPRAPVATSAYSCQLAKMAPHPWAKCEVMPLISAAVRPNAAPPATPNTAAW